MPDGEDGERNGWRREGGDGDNGWGTMVATNHGMVVLAAGRGKEDWAVVSAGGPRKGDSDGVWDGGTGGGKKGGGWPSGGDVTERYEGPRRRRRWEERETSLVLEGRGEKTQVMAERGEGRRHRRTKERGLQACQQNGKRAMAAAEQGEGC